MRRVHTGHATKAEQALLARTVTVPLPPARHPEDDRGPSADRPAQREAEDENEDQDEDEDDSIDDLDDLDDDTPAAVATGFGLYDAYEEADKW
ncbi:hypothetical protein [Streptomyces hygroscopicus]|uniref:hypothetical protein n=1 Tax=Streptomyces hygroscopicus TaxID=1912 RepID=UPI002AD24589|nr:hypothetical protein [Streptomyces hygroscopicus]